MDGFRALAYVGDGQTRLVSRRGNAYKSFADAPRSTSTWSARSYSIGRSCAWIRKADHSFMNYSHVDAGSRCPTHSICWGSMARTCDHGHLANGNACCGISYRSNPTCWCMPATSSGTAPSSSASPEAGIWKASSTSSNTARTANAGTKYAIRATRSTKIGGSCLSGRQAWRRRGELVAYDVRLSGNEPGADAGPLVQKYSSFAQRCGWIIRSVLNDSTNDGAVRNDTELHNAIDNNRVQGETVRTKRLEALAWKFLVEGQSATRSESGRNEKNYFMGRLVRILKRLGHSSQR